MMFAACSNEVNQPKEPAPQAVKGNTAVATQQPVSFDAYINRATTRAGMTGALTTSTGTQNLQTEGFGVIAYYTDDDLYSPIYQPNFMYNTQVKYDNGVNAWTYNPVQYWPNETGDNAESAGVDRLSIFAYAPYVEVAPATGLIDGTSYPGMTADQLNSSGIVGLTRNAAIGDPFVKYYASLNPANQVDLCWGVAKQTFTSSADANTPNNVEAGKPYLDLVKPGVGSKVSFDFKHALASLNVQVDADVEVLNDHTATNNHDNALANGTRIYVRSVTFEGFVTQGAFNLNADAARPVWYNLGCSNYIDGGSVTVYDGRTDGREAQSEATNESPAVLNPTVIQQYTYEDINGDRDYWNNKYPGVTKPTSFGVTNVAQNLFSSTTPGAGVYVIPSGQPLKVSIVYDVETATDELSSYLADGKTHGVSVENKITKTITLNTGENMKLEAGKHYSLTLHLGMTSVKFDASVADWEAGVNAHTDLPGNTEEPLPPVAPVPETIDDLWQLIEGDYDVTPYKGWRVYADGVIKARDDASYDATSTLIGFVAWMCDKYHLVDPDVPKSHILVAKAKNEGGAKIDYLGTYNYEDNYWLNISVDGWAIHQTGADAKTVMTGYHDSKLCYDAIGAVATGETTRTHTFPAVKAAYELGNAFTDQSFVHNQSDFNAEKHGQWFVPSLGQILETVDYTSEFSVADRIFVGTGYDYYWYWTSTAHGTHDGMWGFYPNYDGQGSQAYDYGSAYYGGQANYGYGFVLPVFAY